MQFDINRHEHILEMNTIISKTLTWSKYGYVAHGAILVVLAGKQRRIDTCRRSRRPNLNSANTMMGEWRTHSDPGKIINTPMKWILSYILENIFGILSYFIVFYCHFFFFLGISNPSWRYCHTIRRTPNIVITHFRKTFGIITHSIIGYYYHYYYYHLEWR